MTAPIFVAESSPAAVRGGLIVMYQVATVTGIVIAYFVDYALAGAEAWRWMLGLSAVPSLLVLLVLARLPDTPRWYVMKGRHDEARATLALTDPEADADRELAEIEDDLRSERGGSVGEMLRAPYLRATLFVLGLGFLIQITGINAVVFYSPMIFKEMGFTGNASLLLLPALVQVGSLVATLVSLSIVDRLGRRPTLLTGIAAMFAATLLLVVVFADGRPDRRDRLARLRRHLRVHRRLQLRLRLARVGVRVRELPVAAAPTRRLGDAHRRPGGEPDHRPLLPQRARVAGRDRRRSRCSRRWRRSRSASCGGSRPRRRAGRSRPSARTGRTAAAGPRESGRRRSASPARRTASGPRLPSSRMSERRADVLIVGGGLGGVAAALAAVGRGLDVVMSEPTDWIGGQLTSQAVPPDEHPWIERLGCTASYRALRDGIRAHYREHFPLTAAARAQRAAQPRRLLRLAARARAAGRGRRARGDAAARRSSLLLEHAPVAAETDGDRVVAVTLRGRGEDTVVSADWFLEASETGDLLPLAGIEHVTGFESQAMTGEPHAPAEHQPGNLQPVTVCFAVDHLAGEDHTIPRPGALRRVRRALHLGRARPAHQPAGRAPARPQPRRGPARGRPRLRRSRPRQGPLALPPHRRARAVRARRLPLDITLVNWPQVDYPERGRARRPTRRRRRELSLAFLHWMQTEGGFPGLRLRGDVVGDTPDGLAKHPTSASRGGCGRSPPCASRTSPASAARALPRQRRDRRLPDRPAPVDRRRPLPRPRLRTRSRSRSAHSSRSASTTSSAPARRSGPRTSPTAPIGCTRWSGTRARRPATSRPTAPRATRFRVRSTRARRPPASSSASSRRQASELSWPPEILGGVKSH